MAALTKKRALKKVAFSTIELDGAAETTFQGGIACFDISTGLVAKAKVDTDLFPIGTYAEDKDNSGGADKVLVRLFNEVSAVWMANSAGGDEVVAADVGGLCYLVDDQTVANNDATNTRSIAGRIWKIDSTKGVLVEMAQAVRNTESGLDV